MVKPLANRSLHCRHSAFSVVQIARIPPEVKLADIAVQVLFTDRVINAHQSALQ